jgi:serine/threonine protein kinase
VQQRASKLEPGAQVGPYQVVRDFGRTYLYWEYSARRRGSSTRAEPVLLKCVDWEGDQGDEMCRMWFDEAHTGTWLHHPHIAQLHDTGEEEGFSYLAMELVPGMKLRQMITRGPLPVAAVISIGLQMLEGLHYAHELRHDGMALEIVHRHLSPDAVILTADGHLKLVDFDHMLPIGFGRELNLVMSHARFSPEQVRGLPLERRTDVFSAAVLLYEASAGRYPFAGASDFELLKNITRKEAEPLRSFVPGFPPALEKVILRGMEKKADQRYQTAAEFGAELAAAASALGVSPQQGRAALATCFDRAI